MSDIILKIHILVRAEMALLQIRARQKIGRWVLTVIALFFFMLALGMLNVAAFFAFSPSLGQAGAALLVTLADALATVVLLLLAYRMGKDGSDEKLALEIRNLAQTEINRDLEQTKSEIIQFTEDIRGIRSSFMSFSRVTENTVLALLSFLSRDSKKEPESPPSKQQHTKDQ